MKFVILFNILLIIGATLAMPESEKDSNEVTTEAVTDSSIDEGKLELSDEIGNSEVDDKKENKNDNHASYFYSSSVSSVGGYTIERIQLTGKDGTVKNIVKVNSPKITIDGNKSKSSW